MKKVVVVKIDTKKHLSDRFNDLEKRYLSSILAARYRAEMETGERYTCVIASPTMGRVLMYHNGFIPTNLKGDELIVLMNRRSCLIGCFMDMYVYVDPTLIGYDVAIAPDIDDVRYFIRSKKIDKLTKK